jgi:hypothetical protein
MCALFAIEGIIADDLLAIDNICIFDDVGFE